MTAVLRIFELLLRKNWQVRKRHWILSLFVQILLPVSIIFTAQVAFDTGRRPEIDPELDSIMNVSMQISRSSDKFETVMFAPTNGFTDELMLMFHDCWIGNLTLLGFYTEDHLITYHAASRIKSAVIIFNETTDYSTKHLHYKIMGEFSILDLYKKPGYASIIHYYVDRDPFLHIQICLDESFIKFKINSSDVQTIPRVFMQRMPYPSNSEKLSLFYTDNLINSVLMTICFTIPLCLEISIVTNEKFRGIHVLMSLNGIPTFFNFFSWIISGLIFLSGFCVIIMILMFARLSENSYALNAYINPLVLLVFFTTHNLHLMAFAIMVTFAYSILNVTAIVLLIGVLEDKYLCMVPYVGIIFPNIFLYQTMKNIGFYKMSGIYIQWTNLFENSNPAMRIENSIGMTLIFSIIGMIFHFFLAIYVHAINPGKYGVGKHPLFLFMSNRWDTSGNSIEDCIYDAANEKLFELAPGYSVGIQIRNLKKTFNVGFCGRKQVQALKDLSIDLYNGQITSLLGHNGAGKSTLISILTGMIKPTSGTVLINSKMLTNSQILQDVGLCAEQDMYFSSLTVTEQLEFFAKVKKRSREGVKTLLQRLKLLNVKDSLPDCLSADQKRKLCLAMAFVGDPSILILDEPTSRLDHGSKRLIWEILLEMQGRKTILISTHDMHEADLLSDRVAIMHGGRLKCYGSSLYLKKILGDQNNVEVTLSIERWSDPDTIRKQIHCEAKIIKCQDKKIIVSVSNSLIKSSFLEDVEKKKSELGVLSYSLSITSLEQVFLRITQENDDSYEAITGNMIKLKGLSLYIQMTLALLFKNMTYTLKELITLLMQIFMIIIAMVLIFIPLSTILAVPSHNQIIHINFDMYKNNPYALYTSYDKTIGEQYKRTCQLQGGNPVEINNTSLYSELIRRAKEDLVDYNKNLIAAAEFNRTTDGYTIANAFYSEEIVDSLPISINLATNVIIKYMLGDDYSISLSKQRFPVLNPGITVWHVPNYFLSPGFCLAVLFVIPFYFLMAMFVIRPARESSRGLKHLQKMTGASGFNYWGTMLLSDMMHYTFLILLLVFGVTSMDYLLNLRFFRAKEIMRMVLILILFAISSLPLVYMVSFIKAKTSTLVKLVAFSCIAIGSVDVVFIMLFSYQSFTPQRKSILPRTLRLFQRIIFSLMPHISFFHAQILFYTASLETAKCRQLPNLFFDVYCEYDQNYCCSLNCYDGECQLDIPFYITKDASFEESIQFLCMASVINFCLLAILEAQLFQKLKIKIATKRFAYSPVNEQTLREKSMISQIIRSLDRRTSENASRDTHPKDLESIALMTYELRKHYKKIKAVEDVSLIVDRGECFAILGANRAGKSVALRMITGEEIPDHGIIFMGDSKKFFLSQTGYCLQKGAIVKCLNAYDHLRLFARLRGVPGKLIENEVRTWINRLNLGACAALPTHSYSSGNKQRLNIAIALIGSPQLILLDEPTIRVDPSARRSFWNTIKTCQAAGQTVLLTSHNMEECEVLSNRMAIMVEGKLTCFGTPAELKQRFGAGYDVQIRMNPRKAVAELDEIKNSMRLLLGCTLTNENTGSLLYYVSGPGTTWKRLYYVLDELKNKYECIDDYIVIVRLSN